MRVAECPQRELQRAEREEATSSSARLQQSERPQLNTIRHVVIWLDPWSRKRDVLAAVVDR